ncbi:MAG: hypothetical protein ACKVW3_01800 [Phycisphaerales bacterium]
MSTSLALTAITGSLTEKTEAFKQIAMAASSGMFAGFDTPPKVIAGCWSADALGVHPAVYFQNVHAFEVRGKLTQTPKWEFEAALLQSRVPGFRYVAHQEDERAADIEMFSAAMPEGVRVRYTWENAVKQKLPDRNPTWYSSTQEMLWKQAWHRGARRIGAYALMGLPAPYEIEDGEGLPPERAEDSGVVSLPESVGQAAPSAPAAPEPPQSQQPDDSAPRLLVEKIRELWPDSVGRTQMAKAALMSRVSLAIRASTGAIVTYANIGDIPANEAAAAHRWLLKNPPEALGKPPAATEAAEEEPPLVGEDAPPVAVERPVQSWTELALLAERFGKLRAAQGEVAVKSGVKDATAIYLVHQGVLERVMSLDDQGRPVPMLLHRGGVLQVSPSRLGEIITVLRRYVDDYEAVARDAARVPR